MNPRTRRLRRLRRNHRRRVHRIVTAIRLALGSEFRCLIGVSNTKETRALMRQYVLGIQRRQRE